MRSKELVWGFKTSNFFMIIGHFLLEQTTTKHRTSLCNNFIRNFRELKCTNKKLYFNNHRENEVRNLQLNKISIWEFWKVTTLLNICLIGRFWVNSTLWNPVPFLKLHYVGQMWSADPYTFYKELKVLLMSIPTTRSMNRCHVAGALCNPKGIRINWNNKNFGTSWY